ncbi:hypothetical protein BDP27DRAFT_762517 [Rhodocollybia butyracea]|uniref:Uncharacterized protein n=1 Tax=Rhodocollybia butyracea TaxID=206335 RepID=A0A9P5PUP4_9AGAR|nr:hypothetical protein BDP27DRAFT_762517 [Rhodocollybia butyracea]
MAVIQMTRTEQRKANRSNSSGPAHNVNSTNLTSLPPRRAKRKDMGAMLGPPNSPTPVPTPRALPSPSPSAAYATFPGRTPVSPELTSPVSARQFHLPFSPLLHDDNDQLGSSHSSTLEDRDVDSFVSSAFPTFAPPSRSVTPPNPRDSPSDDIFSYYLHRHSTHRDSLAVPAHEQRYSPTTGWDWYERNDNMKWSQHENRTQSQDHDLDMNLHGNDDLQAESVRSFSKDTHNQGFGDSKQGDVEIVEDIRTVEDHSNFRYITRSLHANSPMMSSPLGSERRRHLSVSSSYSQAETQVNTVTGIIQSAIWRIIIFQLSFTLILILASLSTLIDVITQRVQPSPFGTQHVALLLAAWAPVFIFGSIPSTRRKLMFWKRPRSQTVLGLSVYSICRNRLHFVKQYGNHYCTCIGFGTLVLAKQGFD